MTSPMSSIAVDALRAQVSAHVLQFVQRQAEQLHQISPELGPWAQALISLLRQGKRLRPAFAVWGWQAVAGAHALQAVHEQVVAACASLELLQACALLHDDVMDASALRRGQPTVHRRWQAVHEQHGWQGNSAHFGEAAAILLGDLALGWTDQMYFSSGLDAPTLLRGKPALDAMRAEVSAGQYLDVLAQSRGETDLRAIETVLIYKSAKYTVERPLHLGALLADAAPAVMEAFTGYGVALGQAFQLRDDLLGVFGDSEVTGKPAGDDLREGKRTLLVATALQRAQPAQRLVLQDALGCAELDADLLHQARQVLRTTGAVASVEQRITALHQQALQALHTQSATLDPSAVQALEQLAQAATQRHH